MDIQEKVLEMKKSPKGILIRSRTGAREFDCDRKWAGISIAAKKEDWPVIPTENQVDLLRILFYDASSSRVLEAWGVSKDLLFNSDHAIQILDWVLENWDNVELFMIHCAAGLSRSPGVGAAIAHCFQPEGSENYFFDKFAPNPHVYRTILNTYYEDPKYGIGKKTLFTIPEQNMDVIYGDANRLQ